MLKVFGILPISLLRAAKRSYARTSCSAGSGSKRENTMKLIRRPTTKQYPGQNHPQRKRLTLQADGNVTLDYNPEFSSAMTLEQWNKVTIVITFGPYTYTRNIIDFYAKNKSLFERIYAGRSIESHWGDPVVRYNADAEKALEELEYLATQVI